MAILPLHILHFLKYVICCAFSDWLVSEQTNTLCSEKYCATLTFIFLAISNACVHPAENLTPTRI